MIRRFRFLLLGPCLWASLVLAAAERVDDPVSFAYPTPEGVAWVEYYTGIILSKKGDAQRPVVWTGNGGFAAMAGDRLAMVSGDNLLVFSGGSWIPFKTPIEQGITALAGSPTTAIAFDETSAVWRLERDDTWRRHETGLKDDVQGVAYGNGRWVAVGATKPTDEEYESAGPAGHVRPSWDVMEQKPRAWWSVDGVTWQAAVVAGERHNKLMAVAGTGGDWVAAAVDGRVFSSPDGKTWTEAGAVGSFSEETPITLRAVGGYFWIRFGVESPWKRSGDGRTWYPVPLYAGAAIDTMFMQEGKIMAVGVRAAGRPVEVAPVDAFAVAPPPTAAELAVKAAAEEKVRQAAAARFAEVKRAADAKALAAKQAAEAKAKAELKATQAWPVKLAAWDVAMTGAKDTTTRLKLTRALHADWKAAHPGFSQPEVLAYLGVTFERVIGYETSDASVYGFISDAIYFSLPTVNAFIQSLAANTADVIRNLAKDQVLVIRAEQAKMKPPEVPVRIKTVRKPPAPARSHAVLDIEALRQLAAGGDAAAAYDLGTAYSRGQGVPLDSVASRFWLRFAGDAGLEMPPTPPGDLAAQAEFWRRLAEQGSRMGRHLYGYMLQQGNGVPVDHEAAHREFIQAAAVGHRQSMVALAQQYRKGEGTAVDLAAARKHLEVGAGLDFPPAVAELGWTYEAGAGVPRDLTKAAGLYRRAAELGYVWAMNHYANFLLAGHGVPVDVSAARGWMEKAAAQGDTGSKTALAALAAGTYQPPGLARYTAPRMLRPVFDLAKRREQAEAGDAAACYDLAYAYLQGMGVLTDPVEGNRWLDRAKAAGWNVMEKWGTSAETRETWQRGADQGSIVAHGRVALSTFGSAPEAVAIIRRAAEAGSAIGQRLLGGRYREGLGVTADPARALLWIRRAAEIGDAEAQTSLGYAYQSGEGVAPDPAAATHWYRLAAEGDNRIGMANLAYQLTRGLGVAADPREAASWYLKLAELPADPVAPAEAAQQIRAQAEQGNPAAYAVWGILLLRGFGVATDNDASFAYGYAAAMIGQPVYQLSWFEPTGPRRAPALRQAAGLLTKAFEYLQEERAEDPAYAEKLEQGEFPTIEGIFKLARPENATAARVLRAIEDGTLNVELARTAGQSHEPFKMDGFIPLVTTANERTELAHQPWLLRLAGVSEVATDAAAREKLFQAALLAPAPDAAATARQQTLRRLAAARLYYGIGREADRPAALAWALVSLSNADSLFAIALLTRELTPEQIASADELYQRITARLAPAAG